MRGSRLHSLPMKFAFLLLVPFFLMLAGCKPNGHGVRQTMFQRDVILVIPTTDFEETNRQSIRVLPHTWVSIKQISAVYMDGTIIPCRDFESKSIDLVRDTDTAQLLGTLTLSSPNLKELIVDIDRTAQCSAAEGSELHPCELVPAVNRDTSDGTKSDTDVISLKSPVSQQDSDSHYIVMSFKLEHTKAMPTHAIPIGIRCATVLPASIDAIQSPWMLPVPKTEQNHSLLPFGLTPISALKITTGSVKGTIQPDTRLFTPVITTEPLGPDSAMYTGTVVRLDISKRTFQLRVDESSNGLPYATLFFRVMDETAYGFAGSWPLAAATFDDISVGRRLWVRSAGTAIANERLDALEVQIADQGNPHQP